MHNSTIRISIKDKIRPFPRVATYPTGWAGQRTFEQIYEDLIPSFNRLLRYYRKRTGHSRPDCSRLHAALDGYQC